MLPVVVAPSGAAMNGDSDASRRKKKVQSKSQRGWRDTHQIRCAGCMEWVRCRLPRGVLFSFSSLLLLSPQFPSLLSLSGRWRNETAAARRHSGRHAQRKQQQRHITKRQDHTVEKRRTGGNVWGRFRQLDARRIMRMRSAKGRKIALG